MKNSGKVLRTAYYTKLNDAVTIRGKSVPVYAGGAPIDTTFPYISLTSQTATGIGIKGSWADDRTILIDIVTSASEGITGPAESEDIAGQVCALIAPNNAASWPDVGPDFQLTTIEKIGENDFVEGAGTDLLYRKTIRMRHQIHEL